MPILYFQIKLPKNESVAVGSELNQLFNKFNDAKFEQSVPNLNFNSYTSLKCSVCYPKNSSDCNSLMTFYIARYLTSADTPNSHLYLQVKSFYLSKSIQFNFSNESIENLFFGFSAIPFNKTSLEEMCTLTNGTPCSALSHDGALKLGLHFRQGNLNQVSESLLADITQHCSTAKNN